LAENIEKVVRAFYPRPVILRFSDFKSNEYKDLPGGEEFEPKENNPMIGFRGCYRYIHPMFKKAFELEIEVVKKVREKGLKNLWVMVPFVRKIGDIKKVRKILEEKGLLDDPTMKLFIMAEVPSVALQIDEFCKYCDGFSIGSNDLTQLTLGVDRDSDLLAEEFDERDPAVLKAIEMIVKGAKRNGKYVSICGQAPSNYPEIVEYLVKLGIDSISVNPDKVIETRKLVAKIEKKILAIPLLLTVAPQTTIRDLISYLCRNGNIQNRVAQLKFNLPQLDYRRLYPHRSWQWHRAFQYQI
jgi:pyruvate,water dikinase